LFSIPQEHKNWDALIGKNLAPDDLPSDLKSKAANALEYLKQKLGDKFVSNCYENRQPRFLIFVNMAPWAREWVIWFAEVLRALDGSAGYPKFLRRLRDAKTLSECISILNWASAFYEAGFNIEFEPTISTNKKADLLIRTDGSEHPIYVEISVIGESELSQRTSRTSFTIWNALMGRVGGLRVAGIIYKNLSDRHVNEIVLKIAKSVQKLSEGSKVEFIEEKGVLELGMARNDDIEPLQSWCSHKNLRLDTIYSPRGTSNEIVRTINRIKNEQKQLPPDCPGIVIIINNNLIAPYAQLGSIIDQIEETIYDHPHISLAILAGGWGGTGTGRKMSRIRDHYIIVHETTDLFTNTYLIFKNDRFGDHKILDTTFNMIKRALPLNIYQTTYM
jgi:hypothetical protein